MSTGLQSLKKAFIWTKAECVRPYYAWRMSPGAWKYLNRKAIQAYRAYRAKSSPLSEEQIRVIRDLEVNGIAVTSLDALGFSSDTLGKLQAYTEQTRPNASINKKKTFWLKLWDTVPVLDLENPFVPVSLSAQMLGVINGYLGLFAKFYYYSLHVTMPVEAGEEPRNSQRWHRDPEDKKMCKFFIYLNDVDETSGPFNYVQGSNLGGKWRNLYPQRPPMGSYPPIDAVDAAISPSDVRTCTGKAGTVIFADTSGLHKGGYATAKERVMFMAGFITFASYRGVFYKYPPGISEAMSGMDEQARFAALGHEIDKTGLGY